MGFEDGEGSLLDRLSPQVELKLGRWIFPMVGLRGDVGFATSRGFISKQSYLDNRAAVIKDYGNCWGQSFDRLISGGDTINGSLGGYYWPVDDNDNLFVQKWKYVYAGLDFMVNFSYMKKYNKIRRDMRWNHIGYVGFHVRVGLSENHPQKFSNFIGYSKDFGDFKNTNFAAEGHIGYNCTYALSKHFNLMGDIRLSLLEGDFDRERIENVERMEPDLDFSVMAGISYDFCFRSERARRRYYVERGIIPYNYSELPKFISYVQQEDVDVIKVIDTIKVVQYDTIDDLVSITEYDSLVTYYDTSHARLLGENEIPDDEPLDSIFQKRLLPYEMVFFKLDKWDILPQEEMKIAKMARLMKAYPDHTFYLFGSADSKTGTVKRNIFLSHRRADVVYDRLTVHYGIPESQLKREYLGGILEYDPYILNRTTVIIMDHPAVRKAFEAMKAERRAGGGVAEY